MSCAELEAERASVGLPGAGGLGGGWEVTAGEFELLPGG